MNTTAAHPSMHKIQLEKCENYPWKHGVVCLADRAEAGGTIKAEFAIKSFLSTLQL